MKQSLTFEALRRANIERVPRFNMNGAHQCEDWTPADWMQAVVGELGELANLLKKVRRNDFPLEEVMPEIRKEFADVLIYFDILAWQFGIDLGEAVREKFNEVSHRVDAGVFILPDNRVTIGKRG